MVRDDFPVDAGAGGVVDEVSAVATVAPDLAPDLAQGGRQPLEEGPTGGGARIVFRWTPVDEWSVPGAFGPLSEALQ
ncbi:hypothetical protein ACIP93_28055 [Streptomyces sp. NPDC088745]|uniref:hypothetical protein n=1 Tax=Streptomyces sp. NPDC088745 TaxID=3365884 RepID=UPI003807C558